MIPVLKTCCCGNVSVRTAALFVAALLLLGSAVHFFINILDASGAINTMYGGRGCIDIMIIDVVSIVVNILLIVGIVKRKDALMKAAAVFYLVLAAFFFAVTCALYVRVPSSDTMSMVLVVMGPLIAIFCYIWLIIYSYYQQLKNEMLANSAGKDVNSPLAVVAYPCPKKEHEMELSHHRT